MNGLLVTFLVISAIGLIFLMISLLIGDLFESLDLDLDLDIDGDGHFGVFDSRVISVFLTAFGGLAALTIQWGYGFWAAIGTGLVSGMIFGGLVFGFGFLLHSQQSTSNVRERDLIGRTATVTVVIKPGSVGQVSCIVGEERVDKLARTRGGKDLPEGTQVLIEEHTGDGVFVSPMGTA
ncbi:MAG: hypothetical protein R2684_04395 [Pyrinomonadaceae bacterium]